MGLSASSSTITKFSPRIFTADSTSTRPGKWSTISNHLVKLARCWKVNVWPNGSICNGRISIWSIMSIRLSLPVGWTPRRERYEQSSLICNLKVVLLSTWICYRFSRIFSPNQSMRRWLRTPVVWAVLYEQWMSFNRRPPRALPPCRV